MIKKITFTLPAEAVADATEALLLGDFNEWNTEKGIVLKKQKDGSLKALVALETGKSYQYRFLLNDGRWVNDYNAQNYIPVDGFHIDNCLITIDEVLDAPKPTKKKTEVVKKEIVKNDLTKIEGIGKQIATLLNKNEINSFAQLAKTTATKLKEILASGGNKFQIHNPGTWPKQAKLASAEKWEELEELQNELKGGK